ncbi:uncharacterized protein LOC127082090 [Lathyrus oleraceus]|uniref:uncharacterized protein LOC127082090 n=1 Tax=Pisum sativum TaxID=3888 RepID=UPI0021CEA0EF|nr:uncharacterized protein LOC127082090 [Pisum sativum]
MDIASNFKIPCVTDDAFTLRLFPYSLRDRSKSWLNSLVPNPIATWNDLDENIMAKYFPPSKNSKRRNEITSFRQRVDDSLFDAWERFKELLRQCPHHGIPICIQLETFYNGLVPSSRNMLDASSGGALLSKSYEEGYKLIESITTNTYQCTVIRKYVNSTQKRPVGVHEVTKTTTFVAQVAQIHKMMKNLMTLEMTKLEPIKVVTNASAVSCMYYGGARLFEECSTNLVFVNYVSNNKYNNLYSNTYNPGWHNHPNLSWSNNQNQIKPQVTQEPQISPGYYAPNYVVANQWNNQLKNILKSFTQETKDQFQSQGVSIKNLENHAGKIATALSSRKSMCSPKHYLSSSLNIWS